MAGDVLLTLTVDPSTVVAGDPALPVVVRRITPADTDEIGALYWRAYPVGEAVADEGEAVADIAASFAGAYGVLWEAASLAAIADGRIAAVVMIVRRAAWSGSPDGPFVIEVFTDPERRRTGLAKSLLRAVLIRAAAVGEATVGLRVDRANTAALALYRSLGFRPES